MTDPHVLWLDHVVVLVSNLAAAEASFERAGFILGRRGAHAALGTRNRLVMLEGAYLELLAVDVPTAGNERYRELLDEHGGAVGVALHSVDLVTTAAALDARGIAHGPPASVARPIDTGISPSVAQFRLLTIDARLTPGSFAFYCEHRTPALVWETHAAHRNGATRVTALAAPPAVRAGLSQLGDIETARTAGTRAEQIALRDEAAKGSPWTIGFAASNELIYEDEVLPARLAMLPRARERPGQSQ